MRRWWRIGRRGIASVEFAISVPVVLVMVGWMYDLSNVLIARIQLSNAVENAASYAVMTGTSISPATLTNIVQKAGMLSGVTPTITGPACYCITYSPTALSAATCGSPCAANGTTAGTYVLISATYTYAPLLPDLSGLTSTPIVESATVKLQ